MDVHHALPLLAGLSPVQFMRRHWQKKPLLVRGAIVDFKPLLSRMELFKLAASHDVESRSIIKNADKWRMKSGPFGPRSLPPTSRPDWTLLVQGVNEHHSGVHQLLQQFRFVPDARLDDVMVSFATPGGGVGPHFDSYDVFLLQASGRRRWKISQQKDLTLQEGVPLKILQNFEPTEEFVLDAGDMLYLPPRYAHEGIAEAAVDLNGKAQDCMTYSIGFKAPVKTDLAAEVLQKLAEFCEDAGNKSGHVRHPLMYQDARQAATPNPALLPPALVYFAESAVRNALQNPLAIACALGEIMTMPKPQVWFAEANMPTDAALGKGVRLDAKTRMLYDADHVFINGESYRAKGADATLMRKLADERNLPVQALRKASAGATALLQDWHAAGWVHFAQEVPR